MIVFKAGNMDEIATVWMATPSEVHIQRIGVVILCSRFFCGPLNIDTSRIRIQQAIIKFDFRELTDSARHRAVPMQAVLRQ